MTLQRYQAAKVGLLLLVSGLLLLGRRPLSFATPLSAPAITITQPDGIDDLVGEGVDFATTVLSAPWGMNSNPYPDFPTVMGNFDRGSFSISGGIWNAYTSNNDPAVMIHPTGLAQPVMKDGSRFPIDTSKYRLLSFRLYSSQPGGAQIYWFYDATYSKFAWSKPISISSGWKTYVIDLATYGVGGSVGGATGWDGLVRGLRIDPVSSGSGVNIKFDWIRLTTTDTSQSLPMSWSGLTPADATLELFIDLDNSGYDGTKIAHVTNAGGSGTFNWGASLVYYGTGLSYPLPSTFEPGDYYVYAVVNGSPEGYSSGPLTINQAPTAEITQPSRSSGEDYATTVVGNPWDMGASPDVVATGHIVWSEYSNGVYHATSDSSGDPNCHLNLTLPIDSSKYRYVTYRTSLDGTQDIGGGWVARVVWWGGGGPGSAAVTDDIVVYEGWQTYTLDLTQVALEYGPTWTSEDWTTFRLDPHEVSAPQTFHLDYVLLTAIDVADASFGIEWSISEADSRDIVTTTLYYDSDTIWENGQTFIAQVTPGSEPPSPPSGQYEVYLPLVSKGYSDLPVQEQAYLYSWNTSSVPAGSYYIWAVVTDGYNSTRSVSETPVVISH